MQGALGLAAVRAIAATAALMHRPHGLNNAMGFQAARRSANDGFDQWDRHFGAADAAAAPPPTGANK